MSSISFFQVTKTLGLRPAAKGDLAEIHTLLQAELRKFQLSKILSLQEVEHWLLPRENVVDTYVVEVNFYLKQHALSCFLDPFLHHGSVISYLLLLTYRGLMVL